MRVEKLDDIELRCQDCMEYMRGLEEGHELVGCEINEEYFDKMVVRVKNSMVQGSLF